MKRISQLNDRIGRVLLFICTIGAFSSFILTIENVASADSATKVVEIWRMYGFILFTGLFLLLTIYPRRYAGLWELAFFHKAAVSVTIPLTIQQITPDIQFVAMIDGILALIVLIAYFLTKGYLAWQRFSNGNDSAINNT
ncbi:hypothetical protein [Paenibacillus piri]|uniref:Uncharacterized protein n=1 Tax=Paenibacillus piri TaxID=2547395 RepID=A0A4R5KCG3_9BACL|nr:hypothetical protein [Paenibacillus piri]TDF92999.1 hypothetical protein E1757_28465 [Paenibacillus piri]